MEEIVARTLLRDLPEVVSDGITHRKPQNHMIKYTKRILAATLLAATLFGAQRASALPTIDGSIVFQGTGTAVVSDPNATPLDLTDDVTTLTFGSFTVLSALGDFNTESGAAAFNGFSYTGVDG